MAISTEPMNATAGHAEISAPSSPYPAPKAMFAPIVAPMPEPQHEPGQPRRVPAVAGLVQQHERGRQDQAIHAQRQQPGRRAVLPVDPAQTVDMGIRDHRREGGHGADHGRRRQADHPVPGHRAAPRPVAGAAPLEAVRGRISEPSRKQHG